MWKIVIELKSDDIEVIRDLVEVIEKIAPYMVDNVVVTGTETLWSSEDGPE